MPKYTVQCLYAGFWSNVVRVEADDVEAACKAAIEKADNSGGLFDDEEDDSCGGWESLDDVGETFVARVCEGEHEHVYSPEASATERPFPYQFSELATGNIRDSRELATVLAALRHWQWQLMKGVTPIEIDIATESGTLEPLTSAEIDALCLRLNLGA